MTGISGAKQWQRESGVLGSVLRVDLSREKITVEPLDNSLLRKLSEAPAWARDISTMKCLRAWNGRIRKIGCCFFPGRSAALGYARVGMNRGRQ